MCTPCTRTARCASVSPAGSPCVRITTFSLYEGARRAFALSAGELWARSEGHWRSGPVGLFMLCWSLHTAAPHEGSQHGCCACCGRSHGPCGATMVAHTRSASDGGRGRFDSDCSMGAGGPPSAGGPKERRGAAARSMATDYTVSWRPTGNNQGVIYQLSIN